jgi:hypothetical protein
MAKVKFLGVGTFNMDLQGRTVPYGPGDILDVPDDVAAELLARQEGGQAVWQAVPAPNSSPAPAPAAQPTLSASAPAPAKP